MKIALINDTHFGARADSQIFDRYFEKFYKNIFFPTLEKRNIDTVVHLGDAFDRRKYINFVSLSSCRSYFFDQLQTKEITAHFIVGNHDAAYKATNEVNSPDLLLGEYSNICTYDRPAEVIFDGTVIGFIPWICSDNSKESFRFLESTRSQIIFGHLEISGFQMHRGSISDHGYPMDIFNRFDMVFSGHFHHKSHHKNIWYLGAPYEMTWSDYDDPRGFHIFDTDTRELEYIQNPYFMFQKLVYNDRDQKLDELIKEAECAYGYVKVYVKEKLNPYWFDLFVSKIEEQGIHDLQIIDEGTLFDTEEDFLDDVEDTPTLLKKCCEQIETSIETDTLVKFMLRLHNEALEIE